MTTSHHPNLTSVCEALKSQNPGVSGKAMLLPFTGTNIVVLTPSVVEDASDKTIIDFANFICKFLSATLGFC
jgi:hypothetical protein